MISFDQKVSADAIKQCFGASRGRAGDHARRLLSLDAVLPPPTLSECRHRGLLAGSAAPDWLDVIHAAAIPMRAEPAASRCGEMVE